MFAGIFGVPSNWFLKTITSYKGRFVMAEYSGSSPILGLVLGVGCIVNLAVHIWTVVLAYQMRGFWPMVATFVLPGIAECYWAYMLWNVMPYYSVIAVT